MHTTYILLGGNQGDPSKALQEAADWLQKKAGFINAKSSFYQTAAWGFHKQPDFLNQVIKLETLLTPAALLQCCLNIEQTMGRVRSTRNAPRVIDIDILFFDDRQIIQPNLVVPHPQIQNRRFVLVPMKELSPKLVHPVLKKTIVQLLAECSDVLDVKKI